MSRVTFLAPDTDAYVASVQRHAAEFSERTGLALDIQILDSDTYFSNAIQDRLAEGGADVFMSGPVLLWEHVGAGLVQPLDEFAAQASDGWDMDDFTPSLLAANRWTGRFGDPLGTGPLLEIPVNCESYNLTYVPEHLERHGLELPTTWEAYFSTAEELVRRSGGGLRGFGQRGKEAWHTMYTGYATQIWSSGGRDFGDDLRCAIGRPEVVVPTERLVEALRAAGPPSWTDQRWYELALDFAAGQYGLIVDSDHYVAIFEDPGLVAPRGEDRLRPAAGGPRRRDRSEPLDVVARHERALALPGGGLALHRVGVEPGVPAAFRVRGQHEPDAGERVGRPARGGARGRLGGLRRSLARARREPRARRRDPGAQLHRHRRALGGRAPLRLYGQRGNCGGARARRCGHRRADERAAAVVRVAALYDIHGNDTALAAVLAEIESLGVDLIVVGGDVAGGPFPRQAVDAVQALGDRAITIRGNGERELVEARLRLDDGTARIDPDDVWSSRTHWAAGVLDQARLDWMAALPAAGLGGGRRAR